MYPRAESYTTSCVSSRRRALLQHQAAFAFNQLLKLDPLVILKILQTTKKELMYTQLENTWIISYLQKHNQTLLDGLLNEKAPIKPYFRRIQFTDRKIYRNLIMNSVSSTMQDDKESILLREFGMNPSLCSPSCVTVTSGMINSGTHTPSRYSDADTANAILVVSITYKTELCTKEINYIDAKNRELMLRTTLRQRKLLAKIENIKRSNEEVQKTRFELKEYLGSLKVGNVLAHREQCNRLRKFINSWLSQGERQVQQIGLKNLSIQRELSIRFKTLASKQIRRGNLLPVDFTAIQIDVDEKKIKLNQLDCTLRSIREQSANTALKRRRLQDAMEKATIRFDNVTKQIEKSYTELDRYDNERETYEKKVDFWAKRVADAEMKHKTSRWPTIDEYMMSKRQLANMDHELSTLRRVQRISEMELKVALGKVSAKKADERKNWFRAVALI